MNQSFSNNVKTFGGRLAVAAALALTLGASSAMACSLANWADNPTNIFANQPDGAAGDPANAFNIPRYSELCGSMVPDGQVGFVQDNRPAGIANIVVRFYVFNDGAVDPQVYAGFSDTVGGGQIFSVDFTGGNANIEVTAGGASASAPAQTGWNSVEIEWDPGDNAPTPSGNGVTLGISVNGAPQVSSVTVPPAASLASVRLGNLNGAVGGNVMFDGYESHRSTPVGRFLVGDADGSGAVGGTDISAIVAEFLNGTLATGQPDCNEDGSISGTDISCVVGIFLGS